MNNQKKLDHIVLLRGGATILVVFAHATRNMYCANAHMYSPQFTPWWEMSIKSYIYSFHMPLFFWISGFVFYYTSVQHSRKCGFFSQIFTKFKRLIVPMYFVSFTILLPTILLFGHINGSLLHQIKLFILGYNNDHLWFLKSLFLIFVLIIPIKNFLDSNSKLLFTLPVLWFCLNYVNIPHFGEAVTYVPFFLIGFYWCKFEDKFCKLNLLHAFLLTFTAHLILLLLIKTDLLIIHDKTFWYLIAFLGIFYMYCLMCMLVDIVKKANLWNFVMLIDRASYSIYLWHVTFLYIILYFFWKSELTNSLARVGISFFVGLIGSVCIHFFLSKTDKIALLFGVPKIK